MQSTPLLHSQLAANMLTPNTVRRTTKRELQVADIPTNISAYLQIVFPSSGVRPPILHSNERNPDGFPTIYVPDLSDATVIEKDQHWLIYRSRSDMAEEYHIRVIKWLAYVIGVVVHHVAICECLHE